MTKLFLLLSAVLLLCAGFLWKWHENTGAPHYISSQQCQQCHPSHYDGWKDSLHAKMFHPAGDQEILADFNRPDPALSFTKDDIQYVIGNKWEQIYVQMLNGEYYPLPAKWLVAQQRWEPYRVDTWRDTPMSMHCNGCHVTGFDVATLTFNEFSIGCEACHGPGSSHVNNRKIENSRSCRICHRKQRTTDGDIVSTVSGAVCGQCHNRGTDIADSSRETTTFNFPVNKGPGEGMGPSFKTITPENDTKNTYWWGNGIAKKRHQEFAEWEKSNHALSLKTMHEKYSSAKGPVTTECLTCHAADFIVAREENKPDLHSAAYVITCVVCHNPHGNAHSTPTQQKNSPCLVCHTRDHSSCPSPVLQPHFPCPEDKVRCEDCHMPYSVKNAGEFSIRSHRFTIFAPDAKQSPNSCQNGDCHQDKSQEWAAEQFTLFYPTYLTTDQ